MIIKSALTLGEIEKLIGLSICSSGLFITMALKVVSKIMISLAIEVVIFFGIITPIIVPIITTPLSR